MSSEDIVPKGETKPKRCGDNREEYNEKTTNWKTDGRKAKPQTSKGNDIQRDRQEAYEGIGSFVKSPVVLYSFRNHSSLSQTTRSKENNSSARNNRTDKKSTRTRRTTSKDFPQNFALASPEKQHKSNSSIKSLIHEMGFQKDSQEFAACMKFLETIKLKTKDNDAINVIDMVSHKSHEDYKTPCQQ